MSDIRCEVLHGRATALQEAGQLGEAVALYRECLSLNDRFAPTLYNLGMLFLQQGHYPEACQYLQAAHHACPGDYNLLLGYGIALKQSGRLAEALSVFCQCDRLRPDQPHALCNLAAFFNSMGQADRGDCFLLEATLRSPEFPNVRWLNAMRLLRKKQYRQGWPLFESRFELSGQTVNVSRMGLPYWQGETRPWAVLREQGHGDCLMMARFLKSDVVAANLVYVEVTTPLVSLFQHNFPQLRVGDAAHTVKDTLEAVLPFMSLPGRLDLGYDGIPGEPYLTASPDKVALWRSRLPDSGLRVAVYWRGSPRHANDAQRSIPFAAMQVLLSLQEITWISIQHDATAEELSWLAARGICHVGDQIQDFSDSAALLLQVNLLVGVDSAPIHLAGALGIPVWLLLASSPDWRWGERGHRAAWYRRMLLIRQAYGQKDWHLPLARVRRGLRRWVGGNHE